MLKKVRLNHKLSKFTENSFFLRTKLTGFIDLKTGFN